MDRSICVMASRISTNNIADPETRERVGRAVLDALADGTDLLEVSIFEPQNSPAWIVILKGPHGFTWRHEFSGPLEQTPEFVNFAVVRAISQQSIQTAITNPILERFALLSGTSAGIETWLTKDTNPEVFERLNKIDENPLSKVQLDQLLVLAHEAGVSDGFFEYYWLTAPPSHPYDVTRIPNFKPNLREGTVIQSLDHLGWGLYRLYVDALLFFGNIRSGYRYLRSKTATELEEFFKAKKFDTAAIKKRGPALALAAIPKDNRYLISEIACKSHGATNQTTTQLQKVLTEALQDHLAKRGGRISVRELLDGSYVKASYAETQSQLVFSAEDILDEEVTTREQLEQKYAAILEKFKAARGAALKNTALYLSMVNDLDVYVATSMRSRQEFREMADTCQQIFADKRLEELELRYFDPTLSAAEGHEDKGLIECLMVKCAKVLVYCAGKRETYGKDAEAAMALSLGKPVIFYCDEVAKSKFYRDIHPLSRLIDFSSGVAVGAMVTSSIQEVSELLRRIFENQMEYELEQPKPGYFRLKEKLTQSVVRVHKRRTPPRNLLELLLQPSTRKGLADSAGGAYIAL